MSYSEISLAPGDFSESTRSILGSIYLADDERGNSLDHRGLRRLIVHIAAGTTAALIGVAGGLLYGGLNQWVWSDKVIVIFIAIVSAALPTAEILSRGKWARRERRPEVRSFLTKGGSVVKALPGSTVLVIARFMYSQRTFEEIFQPTAADLWQEYAEALAASDKARARWIRARGYITFVHVVMLHGLMTLRRIAISAWRAVSS